MNTGIGIYTSYKEQKLIRSCGRRNYEIQKKKNASNATQHTRLHD